MTKVGTLTFPGSPSHGASLQMLALHTTLNNLGADAEVINYISDKVNHKKFSSKTFKDKLSSLFLKDTDAAFRKFESQVRFSHKDPITTTEELRECVKSYDRIIVGSDQVWNPVVTGNDMNFYLEFCDECEKKASYAPSFGVDQVAIEDQARISRLLSDITYLSAREERGREMIQQLTGRDVPVVLDPTFLLSKEEWKTMKKPAGTRGEYVFFYTIKPSAELRLAARAFADKHGYKLVYISGGLHGVLDKLNPEKHTVSGVGPAEFLDLIDNAQFVFTNSFHGAALSIILNKNFFIEFSSDTNSRLVTLVNHFGLEDNIIDCKQFDCTKSEIDYNRINVILTEKRIQSLAYLKGIIA